MVTRVKISYKSQCLEQVIFRLKIMQVFLGEFLICGVAVPVLIIFHWRLNLLERLSGDLGKGDVLQGHRGPLRVGHQGVLLLDDDGIDRQQTCVSD